ncbi:TetR family transcriptional regulator [Sphingobium sp. SYK-6]|uniref:TetR/AcrR family transcriptional regulator n=1 Tax=Sphingobium sp. (strain NBRC 103272 / SYK-6) TaxID=627192 RepID=UPI0002277069|nr:TetR/AcrR family transcriptional regulator [Sphingobium sp. SYK-6]BAK65806.1 TetR family transcriptional regulator [Sphingobium sp. SYK-6]
MSDRTPRRATSGKVMAEGSADQSSKARFLLAADEQFIRYGYDRCTIRAIAAQAGTSLASLSRNWTSKRHLFEEVFQRHFDPIHKAQHENFDRIEQLGKPGVRDIVQAFFESAISRSGSEGEARRSHMVYCCALTDPSEEARSITRPLVTPVRGRLIALLRRAMPDIDEERFFLMMTIVLGTYLYPQAHGGRLAAIMDFDISKMDWSRASDTLADLVSGGLAR